MDVGQTIIADVKAMICSASGTTHTMLAPVAKRKAHEAMFLDLFFTWQLRIQHAYKMTYSRFLMLFFRRANCCILNVVMMNILGTYSNRGVLLG